MTDVNGSQSVCDVQHAFNPTEYRGRKLNALWAYTDKKEGSLCWVVPQCFISPTEAKRSISTADKHKETP